MVNKKQSKISIKNYILALLILVGGIVLTLYIFEWYQVKQEEKVMNSYLIKTKTVNYVIDNLDSYSQIIQEAPSDYFVVVGYAKDKNEFEIEKELKGIIENYQLNDIVYYLNVTDIKDNDDCISKINETLGTNIKNIPAIIYFKDGKIAKNGVISGETNGTLQVNNFEKLLDIYEYEMTK